jgi:NTE family protein
MTTTALTAPLGMALPGRNHTGLLLPGGGARAAYQVGVLKGLASLGALQGPLPFPILCGTSAGAINALGLATGAGDFAAVTARLEALWGELESHHVYRSGWLQVGWNTARLMASLVAGGLGAGQPLALLDNSPLRELLGRELDFDKIPRHIAAEHLRAVCVTAMSYTRGETVSFFQGGPDFAGWKRWRRSGVATPLRLEHVMASTAIPTVFPPEPIGGHYYGDGALRQLTPISPALHLGAQRILVIPANGHRRVYPHPVRPSRSPAFGQIIGHLLNSAFIDNLETDIEMLERINDMLECLPNDGSCTVPQPFRPIRMLVISPSRDLDALAEAHIRFLPRSMRAFLTATGSNRDSGGVNLASFLLFTRTYIRELIDLGYRDAMSQAEQVLDFLSEPLPESEIACMVDQRP